MLEYGAYITCTSNTVKVELISNTQFQLSTIKTHLHRTIPTKEYFQHSCEYIYLLSTFWGDCVQTEDIDNVICHFSSIQLNNNTMKHGNFSGSITVYLLQVINIHRCIKKMANILYQSTLISMTFQSTTAHKKVSNTYIIRYSFVTQTLNWFKV